MRERLRRPWPDPVERQVDVAYELWDYSIYYGGLLSFLGYVIYNPTVISAEALAAPLEFFRSASVFGLVTTTVLVAACVCSYRERWLRRGYVILMLTASAWCAWMVIGLIAYDAPGRALVSAAIYANIATRSYRFWRRL